jgi:putative DNA primase/helicase
MSRPEKSAGPVQRVLEFLEGVRPNTNGWSALCPVHDDNIRSLSIGEGEDGRVLLKCFAGCPVEDIVDTPGLEMRDLFPDAQTKTATNAQNGGLTLEEYAEAKGLTVEFLRELGVTQIYLGGRPVIRIPYMDAHGMVFSARMRLSMDVEPRFIWKTGSKLCLYGLWRLRNSQSKYICLVEGESDCHTLWLHRFPALGLPGADTWREDWAQYFDAFERIYVMVEADKGGKAVRGWLSKSKIRDRVRLITLDRAKDPSELFLANPAGLESSDEECRSVEQSGRCPKEGQETGRLGEV